MSKDNKQPPQNPPPAPPKSEEEAEFNKLLEEERAKAKQDAKVSAPRVSSLENANKVEAPQPPALRVCRALRTAMGAMVGNHRVSLIQGENVELPPEVAEILHEKGWVVQTNIVPLRHYSRT